MTTELVHTNTSPLLFCTNTFSPLPIPSLIDILNDKVDPDSKFSKINFLTFLVDKHCIENYEFLTELNAILLNYEFYKKYHSTAEWFEIYSKYIESDVINLRADVVAKLLKTKLPCIKTLKTIERTIVNYLLNSYYEFINSTEVTEVVENIEDIKDTEDIESISSNSHTSSNGNHFDIDILNLDLMDSLSTCSCTHSNVSTITPPTPPTHPRRASTTTTTSPSTRSWTDKFKSKRSKLRWKRRTSC